MTAPGGATDKVSVLIVGDEKSLDEALKKAASGVLAMRTAVTRDLEEVGVVSESVGRRLEHVGVSVTFAANALAEGATTGVQRAGHALAALGFAFGPAAGGIALAISIATERMVEFFHKAQDEAKKTTEQFEADMIRLVNAGDTAELLKKASEIWNGTPAKNFKDGIVEMERRLRELPAVMDEAQKAWDFKTWKDANAQLEEAKATLPGLREEFQRLRDAITNTQNAPIGIRGLLPSQTTALSDDAAAKKAKDTEEKFLKDARDYADRYKAIWDDHFDGIEKYKQLGRDADSKAANDAAKKDADNWKAIVKRANDDIAKFRDDRAAEHEEDEKKKLADREGSWLSVFGAIQTAVEQTVQGLVQGTLTMRQAWSNLARSMVLDSIAAFAKIQEARAAHWLAAQGQDAAGLAKSAALHAFDAVRFIAVEAAKAAAAAWTWATVTLGPWLAPAVAAATLVGVLALAGSLGGGGGGSSSGGAGGSAPAGGGGNSSTTIYNISAIDSQSFHQALMRNSPSVAAATMAGSARGVRIPTTPGRGA